MTNSGSEILERSSTPTDIPLRDARGNPDRSVFFTKTNKAEFYRLSDGSLVKRYFTHESRQMVARDRASLRTIQQQMGHAKLGGWVYRIVEPYWFDVDQGMVGLEFASGEILPNIPRNLTADAQYHCGVWLAIYHNRVFGDGRQGLIYTDFTVHNMLVDFDRQTVVAIDPGIFWETPGYAYEDVQRNITSAINALLARRQLPFAAIAAFVKGYCRATDRKMTLRDCYAGLSRELCRQVRDFARLSWRKCGLFLVLLVFLLPFHLAVAALVVLVSHPLSLDATTNDRNRNNGCRPGMSRIIEIIGPPGSGKSTLTRGLLQNECGFVAGHRVHLKRPSHLTAFVRYAVGAMPRFASVPARRSRPDVGRT